MAHPLHRSSLRYPSERVLLARTKLAYVHLRNLLSDAKRDRTGRLNGYVAIWLADEFLVLFLIRGELANAVRVDAATATAMALDQAVAHVPAEPEFGEILFHKADERLLSSMWRALVVPSEPWRDDVSPSDPRSLLPALRDEQFTGLIEVVSRDTANYLFFRDGLIEQTFLCEEEPGMERSEQLSALFNPPNPVAAGSSALMGHAVQSSRVIVRRWPGGEPLPVQAPSGLVMAYRELMTRLVEEMDSGGVPAAAAAALVARQRLVADHPVLAHFDGVRSRTENVVTDSSTLTAAFVAWVTATLRSGVDGNEAQAVRFLGAAARERRHMLQAAGFFAPLPWRVKW
jgi:hypothetical protein